MSDKHRPLTDEQIDTAWDCWFGERGFQATPKQARREFARAIERATAGPAEREALRARAESAEAERDRLQDTLTRSGFVRCDMAACNCGGWHARYGLPERWAEVKQALSDAGHPLCNENGNMVSKALAALVAERDRLRDALFACRPAVLRDFDRYRMMMPTEESKRIAALLDTIDAAAKGQG